MRSTPSHNNNFNLIRLVAAIQVLLVHSFTHFEIEGWHVSALKAVPGVPVFFFISGFLIYQAYERSSHRGLVTFFRNRFLRIYPALWVCVVLSTLTVIATGYLAETQPGVLKTLVWFVSQMTVVQFYNPDFMRGFGDGVLNGALWTITVEIQFYILTPILALLLVRKLWVFLGVLILSVLTNQMLHHVLDADQLSTKLLGVTFLPWVYMFMAGSVAARYWPVVSRIEKVPLLLIAATYLVSMVAIGGYQFNAQNSINPVSFVLIGAMIVKLAFLPVGRLQGIGAIVMRNDISYGTYLYHMPIINLLIHSGVTDQRVAISATLVMTLLLATFSWLLVERPSLRLKG